MPDVSNLNAGETSPKTDLPSIDNSTGDAQNTTVGGDPMTQNLQKPKFHKNLSGFPEPEQPDLPRHAPRWHRRWSDFHRYRQIHQHQDANLDEDDKANDSVPVKTFIQDKLNSQLPEGENSSALTNDQDKPTNSDLRRWRGYHRFYRRDFPRSSDEHMTEGESSDSGPPFPFGPESVNPGDHPASFQFPYHHPIHHRHFHCGRFHRPKPSLQEKIMQEFDFIHN